jgi:hypothetical protein
MEGIRCEVIRTWDEGINKGGGARVGIWQLGDPVSALLSEINSDSTTEEPCFSKVS